MKCGTAHIENAIFCENCGTQFDVLQPTQDTDAHDYRESKNQFHMSLKDNVIAFIQGDESAFNDIYTKTYRKVCVTANTYLKNHADADDAVQDIYIQVYNKIRTIQDYKKALPWIMTITRNSCLNKLEKRKRTEITIDESDDDKVSVFEKIEDERTSSSPESNLFQREHSSIVLEMVANLPIDQKDAVILHYIEQRSVADIAALTNTTTGTVKSRLNYARTKLKDMVLEKEKQGIKLRVRGLFIFLPFFLRYYANTVSLSSEAAGAGLTAIETAVGISTGIGAATGIGTGVATQATATSGSVMTAIGAKTVAVATTTAAAVIVTASVALPILMSMYDEPVYYNKGIDKFEQVETHTEMNELIMQTVSTGSGYSMVILNDGTLWVWGSAHPQTVEENGIGRGISSDSANDMYSPIKKLDDVAFVSSSSWCSAAIKSDGSLWTWGNNFYGTIGDGTYEDRNAPVKVLDDVIYVSTSGTTTFAIKSDNTLWGWGKNDWGELGTDKQSNTPVMIMDEVIRVFPGSNKTMAMKMDHSLWVWGIGTGSTPAKVEVIIGDEVFNEFSMMSWGDTSQIYLVTDGRVLAHDSSGDARVIMHDVTYISSWYYHFMAIKTDGTLWAWGSNREGQLGDGTREYKDEPVMIMEDVSLVSAGMFNTIALKIDGTLWTWGNNTSGELGIGDRSLRQSPVPVQIMENVMLPLSTQP